jgi:hypothetical protein
METAHDETTSLQVPRTSTVVLLLALFAILLSWLLAYALANTLASAGVIGAWPGDDDPRPRWMLQSFGILFGVFLLAAGAFSWMSRRQLRRIDAIGEPDA